MVFNGQTPWGALSRTCGNVDYQLPAMSDLFVSFPFRMNRIPPNSHPPLKVLMMSSWLDLQKKSEGLLMMDLLVLADSVFFFY